MRLINRKLSEIIPDLKKFYHIITITGPRQSGKTTLCKNLFPNYKYYNLEDLGLLEQIKADPKSFLLGENKNIILDEAQRFPDLFSHLQVIVDETEDRNFILTGSGNFSLLKNITESMAGRVAGLTLLPLSFGELGQMIKWTSTEALLLKGSYPEVWNMPDFPYNTFYRNYYSTYVERDVRQIVNVKDLTLFQRFLRLIASKVGCAFNASSLSAEAGVAAGTITNWISLLAASYIVYLLPPFYGNVKKRLAKTPKLYFYDTGLACYLLGIETEPQLRSHPLRNKLIENLVVTDAVKSRISIGKEPNLYFYRDKTHEVSLVYTKANELQVYDINPVQTVGPECFKEINYLKGLFGERITRSALLHDCEQLIATPENGAMNFRYFEVQ